MGWATHLVTLVRNDTFLQIEHLTQKHHLSVRQAGATNGFGIIFFKA
jgi:hypothetical protein